jgi:hypothetical protein
MGVDEIKTRRRKVRTGVTLGLVSVASAIFAPFPTAAKVVILVIVGLGVFVGLAAQIEPKQTKH